MWYEMPPSERARFMRFSASEQQSKIDRYYGAVARGLRPMDWRPANLEDSLRSIKRLEAMAMLNEASTASRAGDVDMLGLQDPTIPTALAARLVDAIHGSADPELIELLAYRPSHNPPDKITVALQIGFDDAQHLAWCEIRSRPDAEGSFDVYAINGFWFGRFEPKLGQVLEDGMPEPTPAVEVWRGHAPFYSFRPQQAVSWIGEAIEAQRLVLTASVEHHSEPGF